MQLSTKKYGGDAMKTYKVLMRKLNRENHYTELKDKEYFKSKGQKRRQEKILGTLRTKRKLKNIQDTLAKELPKANLKNSSTKKQKK